MKPRVMRPTLGLACIAAVLSFSFVCAQADPPASATPPPTGQPTSTTQTPSNPQNPASSQATQSSPSSQPSQVVVKTKPAPAVDSKQMVDTKEIAAVPAETRPPGWLNQKYMLGDWGGERSKLENEGVTFGFNNIEDLQTDVTGSQEHHVAEFGRFRASLDLDLKKLADWDGEIYLTGIWQYGQNLSGEDLNVNTLTSSIAGPESLRIDEAWYQQGLFDSRVKVKVGQIAIVNDFGATDFGDILFNDELGYAPNPIFQAQQPFSPAGKPGVEVKLDLGDVVPGLYTKFAAYTAYVDSYRPDDNGFHYGNDFQNGVGYAAEVGYVEPKTDYAGTYKAGVNINDLDHYNSYNVYNPVTGAYSGTAEQGDYTLYALAEKSVYHPIGANGQLDTKKGLDLMTEFTYAPGDRNLLEYETSSGLRYTGLFPCRPKDKVGAGFILSQAGDHASDAFSGATGQGHLQGEETLELDYQIHIADWLLVQPDVQDILNPRGDMNRDDILILALRTVVTF